MKSAYKWLVTSTKYSYITDEDNYGPFIYDTKTSGRTYEVSGETIIEEVNDSLISIQAGRLTKSEYETKFNKMKELLANDDNGKYKVLLDYTEYFNINKDECGIDNGTYDIQVPITAETETIECAENAKVSVTSFGNNVEKGLHFVFSIPKGCQGPQGDGGSGSVGPQGAQGIKGAQGAQGIKGAQGASGSGSVTPKYITKMVYGSNKGQKPNAPSGLNYNVKKGRFYNDDGEMYGEQGIKDENGVTWYDSNLDMDPCWYYSALLNIVDEPSKILSDSISWVGPFEITNGEDTDTEEHIYLRTQFSGLCKIDNVDYIWPMDEDGDLIPVMKASKYEGDKEMPTIEYSGKTVTFLDHAQGITPIYKYEWEYVSYRTDGVWSKWNSTGDTNGPISLRSNWGENGVDGDGIEYIYFRTKSIEELTSKYADYKITGGTGYSYWDDDKEEKIINEGEWTVNDDTYKKYSEFIPSGWTDDCQGVDSTNQYEWCVSRKKRQGEWQSFGTISKWNQYSSAKSSPIIYPAGEWNSTTEYEGTTAKTPYVFITSSEEGKTVTTYYVLTGYTNESSIKVSGEDSKPGGTGTSSKYWLVMEHYDAVYTEILLANNALVGQAVFNGDYMFSQNGINQNGEEVYDYQDFNANDPYNESNDFRPYYCVNFKTGEVWTSAGKINFKSDGSGQLADGNIYWDADGYLYSASNYASTILNDSILMNITSDTVTSNTYDKRICKYPNTSLSHFIIDLNKCGNVIEITENTYLGIDTDFVFNLPFCCPMAMIYYGPNGTYSSAKGTLETHYCLFPHKDADGNYDKKISFDNLQKLVGRDFYIINKSTKSKQFNFGFFCRTDTKDGSVKETGGYTYNYHYDEVDPTIVSPSDNTKLNNNIIKIMKDKIKENSGEDVTEAYRMWLGTATASNTNVYARLNDQYYVADTFEGKMIPSGGIMHIKYKESIFHNIVGIINGTTLDDDDYGYTTWIYPEFLTTDQGKATNYNDVDETIG